MRSIFIQNGAMRKLNVTCCLILSFIIVNPLMAGDTFSLGGYYKNFFVVYGLSNNGSSIWLPDEAIGMVSNRIRLNAHTILSEGSYIDLSYSFVPRVQDQRLNSYQPGYTGFAKVSYRFDDFDSRLYPKKGQTPESFVIFHNLDRAFFMIKSKPGDFYIGRQAIAWGSARAVNPTDVIAPYSFDELDSEERVGVDAVRLRIPMGFMGEFDTGYLFGKDFKFENSAFYLRSKMYVGRNDISLLALTFRENLLLGFDLARSIGGAGSWLEAAYVIPNALNDDSSENNDNYFRATIGADYSLSDVTYGFIEYHYNQPGSNHAANYLSNQSSLAYTEGSVYLMGEHYIIPGLSYQVTPLVTFSGQILWNISDGSFLLTPMIEYNIAENIYLSGGGYIGFGKGAIFPSGGLPATAILQSEFGNYPDTYFTSFRVYF